MKRISLRSITDNTVLSGSLFGKTVLGDLIKNVTDSGSPEIHILDFNEIDVATASFLRESVIRYRDYCRGHGTNCYPVLANLNTGVFEELDQLLRILGDAVVVCHTDQELNFENISVVGQLEDKQRETLLAVERLGDADASDLKNDAPGEAIGVTGWNNRLSSLAHKGILCEFKQGRSKRYRSVMEVLKHGCGLAEK